MRSQDWKDVREGQTLILTDQYLGVLKVTVIEVDVAVEVTEPTYRKEYPWGKTATTGTIKIRYDSTETVANLADLIKYKTQTYNMLKRAHDRYLTYQTSADAYLETFNTEVIEARAE